MLENYQLGLKAWILWSSVMQRRVSPTEKVKPSGVQSRELQPCDESRTVCARQLPLTGLRRSTLTVSGAWSHQPSISYALAERCATCPGEDCDTLGYHSPVFPSRKAAAGKRADWRPVAHSCAPPASRHGEWALVCELTLQTWHREMSDSSTMNPSWTSTGLLCSPVVQPRA